jgi:uncharacterized RDD family membrane protein YckC
MTTARLAGFATRALALASDVVILNLATLALGGAIAWAATILGVELSPSAPVVAGLAATGWLVLISCYLVLFWSLTGQTPGMRFMGIRVTNLRGTTPGLVRSLRRLGGMFLAALPAGAGFLLVLVDDRRRGFHDRVARTLVIHDGAPRRLHASSRPSSRARETASERERTSSLR